MARNRFRYSSRREKNQKLRRHVNLVLVFAGIWSLIWVIMKRQDIIAWLKTYTY
jgi:hypothetical protein